MSNEFLKQGIYRFKQVNVHRKQGDILVSIPGEDGDLYVSNVKVPQKFRVGDLCSYKEEGTNKVHIGFSLCADSDLKYYSKEIGLAIAQEMIGKEDVKVPASIKEDVYFFILRSIKYFKSTNLPKWASDFKEKMDAKYQ